MFKPAERKPDFSNLAAVLSRKKPSRPTLFEFFLNPRLHQTLTADLPGNESFDWTKRVVFAYYSAGYDYVTLPASEFRFPIHEHQGGLTRSMNDSAVIFDRVSFEEYKRTFRAPETFPMDSLVAVKEYLPAGMKVIIWGPGGVLENVMAMVGYEALCFMIQEEPELAGEIFDFVGTNLFNHYQGAIGFDHLGALISNDDWGFNTQTMLSPADMRKYVFPWHKKFAELAHDAGLYALLHSCGNYNEIIDDVTNDMKFDGRHSYEDKIVPVEQAYEDLKGKIAILGGLDIDFVATKSEKEIYDRAKAMLQRSQKDGSFALGTGNSVPEYIPDSHYFAMISAAFDKDFN